MKIPFDSVNILPPADEKEADLMLAEELALSDKKIVVLDDDPTGVQTVHDISVYTAWDEKSMLEGFLEDRPLFYVLTNSRGLTKAETAKVHHDAAKAAAAAAESTGKDYFFISRSDSTLRGHFPDETEILAEEYEKATGRIIDGEVICPFFPEGGRYTLNNIHYVRYGDELVPACETEFAKDKTFGYTALTMPEYVEEKTAGRYKAEDVICISLEDIRGKCYDKIKEQLRGVENFGKIIVNAVCYADLKIFCALLYAVMREGKTFMFRSAAGLVKVMGGISDRPLLTGEEMVQAGNGNGGVIVIGSHTAKTTAQLENLKTVPGIRFIELDASLVKDFPAFEKETARCIAEEEACIRAGQTVCCYTTRTLITADTGDAEDELKLSVKISDAVQSLVGRLTVTPSFIIAKGGITSSDVGTKALGVKRADVLGQILAGVPVWKTGSESRFPGIPYVIFPGNVGGDSALKDAVQVFIGQ